MRRNSAAIGIAFLLAGCHPPGPQPVWVDVESIASQAAPALPTPSLPSPPKPSPAIVTKLPSRPAELLSDPSHASKESLRASIERKQQAALVALEGRLRAYYKSQVQQFQLEQESGLSKQQVAEYVEANVKIRSAFEAYAEARAPKELRLTILAGFPDPNPNSTPPKGKVKTFMQKLLDEAKSLRADLAALDKDFKAKTDAILATVAESSKTALEGMRKKVDDYRDKLNKQAAQEAAAEVRTSVKDLGLRLTDPNPIFAPATPERTFVVPAETPLPPPPQVPSVKMADGPADRRMIVQHELGIWLGLNRYRLERGATDKTKEFEEWRRKYGAGP